MPLENDISALFRQWPIVAGIATLWAYIEVRLFGLKIATSTNSKDIKKQGERIEKSIEDLASSVNKLADANMQVLQNQSALTERENATRDRVERLEHRMDSQ